MGHSGNEVKVIRSLMRFHRAVEFTNLVKDKMIFETAHTNP